MKYVLNKKWWGAALIKVSSIVTINEMTHCDNRFDKQGQHQSSSSVDTGLRHTHLAETGDDFTTDDPARNWTAACDARATRRRPRSRTDKLARLALSLNSCADRGQLITDKVICVRT